MAHVKVQFDCDNQAFSEMPDSEIAFVLKQAAQKAQENATHGDRYEGRLRDSNGNSVGWMTIDLEDLEDLRPTLEEDK